MSGGTILGAPVVPAGPFATTEVKYVKGGLQVFASAEERDSYSTEFSYLLVENQLCVVGESLYQWRQGTWHQYAISGGSGGETGNLDAGTF